MEKKYQSLLSDNIFYSPDTLTFYKIGYAGMGNDDVRELPTAINSYLHSMLNDEAFNYNESWTVGCVGRFRDENEADENDFDFKGYFVSVIKIKIDTEALFNKSIPVNYTSSRLAKALRITSLAHSQQKRKSDATPYLNHLIDVMNLLVTTAGVKDEDIVIAGLLHDAIEDSDVTQETLVAAFGSRVAKIVASLTDDKSLSLKERRVNTLKKLKTAPVSVKLVKLADIYSNASAIPKDWDIHRIKSYFQWLDSIVALCSDASIELAELYNNLEKPLSV